MSRGKILFLLLLAAGVAGVAWGVHNVMDAWRDDDEVRTVINSKGVKIEVRVPKEQPSERGDETSPPPKVYRGEEDDSPADQPVAEEADSQPPPPPTEAGFEYLQRGEIVDAKKFFLEHVTLHPIDPQGHFGLGVVHRTEEEFVQSVEEFAKTILLDPSHAQAKFQLAEMLTFQTKDDYESAEELYLEVLEQVPEEKSALNGLASVYLSTGRVDQAIDTWEGLRTDMPEQEAIAKNLAEAYVVKARQEEEAGNADLASDWIARARELNPQVTEDQPPPP